MLLLAKGMAHFHCGWKGRGPRVLHPALYPLCFMSPGYWSPSELLICSDTHSPAHPALTHLILTPAWLPFHHFERRGPSPTVRVRKVSLNFFLTHYQHLKDRGHWWVPAPLRSGAEVTRTAGTNH